MKYYVMSFFLHFIGDCSVLSIDEEFVVLNMQIQHKEDM